jgi:MFS superfamily sulfate permease-like transporter
VVVFAPAAAINFTNAQHLHRMLLQTVAAAPQPVRLVVIEASGVLDVDFTGAATMKSTIAGLRARNIDIALARLIGPHAQVRAARAGVIDALGSDHVFKTVQEAVDALGHPA